MKVDDFVEYCTTFVAKKDNYFHILISLEVLYALDANKFVTVKVNVGNWLDDLKKQNGLGAIMVATTTTTGVGDYFANFFS